MLLRFYTSGLPTFRMQATAGDRDFVSAKGCLGGGVN